MKILKNIFVIFILTICACSQKQGINLGQGYRFDYDPVISNDCVIIGPYENTYAITGHVLEYKFDTIFIVAEQKPREEILKNTYNNAEMTLKNREKIFYESTLRFYWIINKMSDSIYGPLTKESYFQKREELKIPKELELKYK
jgi:hypothetical protein